MRSRHGVSKGGMLGLAVAALGLLLMVVSVAFAQDVPRSALRYRADLTRIAHSEWGLDAPLASFAGQIQQESGWNPQAVSRVGALGMAQFMPATANWWCTVNKLSGVDCQPTNPVWAMRSLVQYDFWLSERTRAVDACQRMAFTLSGYNGGLGWVLRDQKLAIAKGLDPQVWFGSVERVNAGRSADNWAENRQYPLRILQRYEPTYVAAGWGIGACHGVGE
ncbi:transglycosylase SLT domain-containing protein [soil metagenome]